MYLSKVHLTNWRSYADATFEFRKPSERKPTVLVGAMNGHGKTSFLISLYLGLFGRFGLRYCEGFRAISDDDIGTYRKAMVKFRRRTASPDEPSEVDLTFTPTLNDSEEEEVRIVRRWYFSSSNQPKPGDAFEEAEIHVGDRILRRTDLLTTQDRVEKYLFPAHVAPAFFFDGEQAQALIENMGEVGLKKAVEVMFGTKIVGELADQVRQYLSGAHHDVGGKRKSSEKETELNDMLKRRDEMNNRIAKLQAEHTGLEKDKEELARERARLTEELARLGGTAAKDAAQIQAEYEDAKQEESDAWNAASDAVRALGLALAVSRMAIPIKNRLEAEELLETWEGLKRGTLEKKEAVLAAAMPEPPENDRLLGNLLPEVRRKVRDRFAAALERIYEPPPPGCAKEYLLGHVKGEMRAKLFHQLNLVHSHGASRLQALGKRLKEARECSEDAKARLDRVQNMPQETHQLKERIIRLNDQIGHAIQALGSQESEMKKLKSDVHDLSVKIGLRQDELARLEPEQRRIAVAERVNLVLDELSDRLKPMTSGRLEDYVTKHFLKIADKRFRGGRIRLPAGGAPEIQFIHGSPSALLESLSGFEKRSFGIAFSLALAEITHRRLPLVIDTPLGNADSEYRPRTLRTLTDFDLDQVIILTHDREVTADLLDGIEGKVCQKFLVEFDNEEKLSRVVPDRCSGDKVRLVSRLADLLPEGQSGSAPAIGLELAEVGEIRVKVGSVSCTYPGEKPVEFVLNGQGTSPHIALMGGVGKGKTTTGIQIATEIIAKARVPFLFVDPKGDEIFRRAVEPLNATIIEVGQEPIPLDFLPSSNVGNVSIQNAAMRLRDTIVRCCKNPGDLQQDLLRTAIENVIRDDSDRDLLAIKGAYEHELHQAGKDTDSIISRLNELTGLNCFSPDLQPGEFFRRSWVISLRALASDELKRLVILLVLDATSSFVLSQGDSTVINGYRGLRHILVIDEARKILMERKYQSLVDLVRTSRSKGEVVMLLSQDPSDFEGQADDFTTQLGTVVAFACAQTQRGLRALRGVYGRALQANEFADTWLPQGVAFCKLPGREPERIQCWEPSMAASGRTAA